MTNPKTFKNRDPEDGLDHTTLRQYTSNLGRWLSLNPVAGSAVNPKSLNRYAYALNNPTGPWPSPDLLAGRGTGPRRVGAYFPT